MKPLLKKIVILSETKDLQVADSSAFGLRMTL